MAPRKSTAGVDQMTEYGAPGLKQYSGYVREEFLKNLLGWQAARMYREMRDNDPVVGAMFFALEMLLRSVPLSIEPLDNNNPDDIEAAAFVSSCLTDMEQTTPEIISEILTFLQFGYHVAEICYKIRGGKTNSKTTNSAYDDGMIGWQKWAGRAQETTLRWEFDDAGDPTAMVQLLPTGGPLLTVPLAKCLHFKTRLIKNNPEGVSALRNAYTSYFYKKRLMEIEAIGVERELAGLPIAWVPPEIMQPGATKADQEQFLMWQRVARDVSKNDQGSLVLPLAYDKDKNPKFKFELLSTGGRRQIDISPIIDRYDHRISATILADFIMLGQGSSRSQGTGAQSKNKSDMFTVAATGFLDLMTGEINHKAIPDLLFLNGLPGRCFLKHGDIARRDLTELAAYLQALGMVQLLTPTPQLETHLLQEAGLPIPDAGSSGDITDGASENDDTGAETPGGRPDGQGGNAAAPEDDNGGGASLKPARKRPTPRQQAVKKAKDRFKRAK
jgi:hypothetical protein